MEEIEHEGSENELGQGREDRQVDRCRGGAAVSALFIVIASVYVAWLVSEFCAWVDRDKEDDV